MKEAEGQWIYGLRAIMEAVEADRPINKVFLQRGPGGDLYRKLEGILRKKGIPASYVPVEKLNRMGEKNHQGAVARIAPVAFLAFESWIDTLLEQEANPHLLLLDQVTDVRNFGAIIRTAECAGVHGIVVPKQGSAPLTDDTVKTSAGAAFRVPIAKVDHIKDAVHYLQASGVQVVAASEKAEKAPFSLDLKGPTAWVMGSEERGVSPSVLKAADAIARIPMQGDIASLNVSVACGVVLYETVRQRLASDLHP